MTRFGTTRDGRDVDEITISGGDITVRVLTYGAILRDLRIAGFGYGLALGSDRIGDYEDKMGYFGAIVGPIANRISTARVRIGGMMYELDRNENGAVHLHSGDQGCHRRLWRIRTQTDDSVTLALDLPDGAAGLPGQRHASVTYRVSAPATLTMTIDATSDSDTMMNFASHIYWNLDGSDNLGGHALRLAADHYLPVDDQTCPTGEVAAVADTDMDFRDTRTLGPGTPPLDHNFCLSDKPSALRDVLWLGGQSGLNMTVATTEPGIQIHDAATSHRPGRPTHEGLVIEPQRWPDAPNHRGFPSIVTTPDRPFHQTTRWTFTRDQAD